MQRMGITAVMFILTIAVSLSVSYFLWGNPESLENGNSKSAEIENLRVKVDALETEILKIKASDPEDSIAYEDFEIVLARLNEMDSRIKSHSSPKLVASSSSTPVVKENLTNLAEEKAREVYENMKQEEKRKQEEEWQRRREERQRETEEWLANVYKDRLALFTKELSLTPTQEVSIRDTLNVRREMILKMYSGGRMSEEERQRQGIPSMDDINNTFNASMQQILNQQQFNTYKEKNLDNFNNRGRGRGRGR